MRPIEDIADEGIELAQKHASDIKRAGIRVGIIFVIAFYTETLFSVKTPDARFERPVFFSQAVNSASLAF